MQSSTAMQRSCILVANEEKVEEEDNKQEEEDKIRTRMQSSVAMQESCTRGPRELFLSMQCTRGRRRRRKKM